MLALYVWIKTWIATREEGQDLVEYALLIALLALAAIAAISVAGAKINAVWGAIRDAIVIP